MQNEINAIWAIGYVNAPQSQPGVAGRGETTLALGFAAGEGFSPRSDRGDVEPVQMIEPPEQREVRLPMIDFQPVRANISVIAITEV